MLQLKVLKQLIVLLLALLCFSSCDPLKVLAITNQSEKALELLFVFKECPDQYIIEDFERHTNIEKVQLAADLGDQYILKLGMGNWTDSDIEQIRNCLDHIAYKTAAGDSGKIEAAELDRLLSPVNLKSKRNILEITINKI